MRRAWLGQALGLGSFISNMEETYMDTLDPERLLQCPYDLKKNQICACRFPYHLIKYKKNNPDYLKNLAICPFSAYHQVPLAEIGHMSSCDDKSCIEQDAVIQEPWTRDSDQAHKTGALLTMNTGIKICRNRPAPHLSGGTANYCGNHSPASQATSLWSLSNLASGLQVPKPLPWKNNGNA